MKNLFLFSGVFFLSLLFSSNADARKKRYIKRMHGVKVNLNVLPYEKGPGSASAGNFNVGLAYSYNWKGMMEVGPYFGIEGKHVGGFALNSLDIGIHGEYNFIKNKGKKELVPVFGLKLGAHSRGSPTMSWYFAAGPYLSLKYFVAKRTPIILSAGYSYNASFNAFGDTSKAIHSSFLEAGFAYYFDFY